MLLASNQPPVPHCVRTCWRIDHEVGLREIVRFVLDIEGLNLHTNRVFAEFLFARSEASLGLVLDQQFTGRQLRLKQHTDPMVNQRHEID